MDKKEWIQLEYASLRQEILNSINACDTYKIAMYTVTVAILAIAFSHENPILFLLPYVVIFAFQWAISIKNENNIAIGAYIAVYLEEGDGWESNNGLLKNKMHRGKNIKALTPQIINRLVGRISSAQLGLLCSILSLVYSIMSIVDAKDNHDYVTPSVCIILSIILYICIRIQTKDVLILSARKKEYIQNLHEYKDKERENDSILV